MFTAVAEQSVWICPVNVLQTGSLYHDCSIMNMIETFSVWFWQLTTQHFMKLELL